MKTLAFEAMTNAGSAKGIAAPFREPDVQKGPRPATSTSPLGTAARVFKTSGWSILWRLSLCLLLAPMFAIAGYVGVAITSGALAGLVVAMHRLFCRIKVSSAGVKRVAAFDKWQITFDQIECCSVER